MKNYIIPIIIPNSQEKTLLTNQKYIITKKDKITVEEVKNIIEEHLKKVNKEEYNVEVAFSGLDGVNQEEFLQIAYEYVKNKQIDSIRITTKANYINRSFLKLLKKYKIKAIELEIQTINEYVLKNIGAIYNVKDIKKASKLIKRKRFDLGLQMMVGLPESSRLDELNTAKEIVKMKPKIASVTPVLVEKGTSLEKEYQEKRYKPLTLVQTVEICEEIVELFNKEKIKVIAIGYGLLDNDIEQLEIAENIVDGPFHPAFRQLVESSLWYNAIVNKIKKLNVKVKQVEVTVNPIDTNNVIGYKQDNINKLKDLYDVELIVTSDEKIKQGDSRINITSQYKEFIEN